MLDEAYLRGFFGPVEIGGGLRKLTWGKADSLGPLDVVNPLDYTDLTLLANPADMKIARPLLYAAFAAGDFTKVEGVFLPWFEGDRFDLSGGRWTPFAINTLRAAGISPFYPDTATLDYAQAGIRFTTTVALARASADFGFQYFYGNLRRPAITVMSFPGGGPPPPAGIPAGQVAQETGDTPNIATPTPPYMVANVVYNRYHQIGIDYAQLIAGFNIRAEAAANITGDLAGDDGSVYNPSLAWSLGFDRDLFWNIKLNAQGTGTVRLFDNKIGAGALADTEAGTAAASTRLSFVLSRAFLRDELELKATGIWGIAAGAADSSSDFLIMPALVGTKGDIAVELSGGIFGGDDQAKANGELGQYHANSFFKAGLRYRF
jgi:hypothetical protein